MVQAEIEREIRRFVIPECLEQSLGYGYDFTNIGCVLLEVLVYPYNTSQKQYPFR